MMLYGFIGYYISFGGAFCLSALKLETAGSSETYLTICNNTHCHNPEDHSFSSVKNFMAENL
jgi:hypothetical protein